jgi:transposase
MLGPEQMNALAAIVEAGPDPETDGVVRWRRIDLCAVVEQRFGVCVAERTMGAILHRLGFAKLSARPRHPQGDAEAQALYKKLRRPGARGAA